ncbi:MAG TPA: ferric reductase-like transmembrane domain-containing protein [Candidatus Saccharimonadales bacterium]
MIPAKKTAILFENPRFYILSTVVAVSVLITSWLRLTVPSDQLLYIRIEQVFGYLCISLWYVALIISPLQRQLGDRFGIPYLVFCRRAIGVSAAYFALLHVLVALFGQIGGFSGLTLLPAKFLLAAGMGTVALVILIAMAATSFNKVIAFMTYPRWKWLHRWGYFGGLLVLLHIWLIGTHMSYLSFKGVIFVMLIVLFRLETLRIAGNLAKRYPRLQPRQNALAMGLWLMLVGLLFVVPLLLEPSGNHHLGESQ